MGLEFGVRVWGLGFRFSISKSPPKIKALPENLLELIPALEPPRPILGKVQEQKQEQQPEQGQATAIGRARAKQQQEPEQDPRCDRKRYSRSQKVGT